MNREDTERHGKPALRILVKGLLFSGSGTAVDLLSEYAGVVQVPGGPGRIAPAGNWELGEFNDFRVPGMVGEQLLEDRRYVPKSRLLSQARKREIALSLLHSAKRAVQAAARGKLSRACLILEQDRRLASLNRCLERLAVAFEGESDPTRRLALARKWIEELVEVAGAGEADVAVFDQPINFGQFDDLWPKVFDPCKLIVVHRDPRDQFSEMYRTGLIRHKWGGNFGYIYGWDLRAAFKFFIDATMAVMRAVDETIAKVGSDRVLLIRFEDVVLNYEESRRRIQEFVGLTDGRHARPRQRLDPDWSRRNIGIFDKNPIPVPASMLDGPIAWYKGHA